MASASTPSANEPAKDLILVHTVQLKQQIKAPISGRMVSSCISDVASASLNSEKTRLKKFMMMKLIIFIIIIMNESQEMTVFGGRMKIDFRYETKARKVMVDFKFDALYR